MALSRLFKQETAKLTKQSGIISKYIILNFLGQLDISSTGELGLEGLLRLGKHFLLKYYS